MQQGEHKIKTDISRRVTVSLLTNQLQQETFIERKLHSVSVVKQYIHISGLALFCALSSYVIWPRNLWFIAYNIEIIV